MAAMKEIHPMRVFLADSAPEVRSALHLVLSQEPDVTIVGEASEADSLPDHIHDARPDLVLLDWELPGGPVSPLLPTLRGSNGRPNVIVLSVRPDTEKAALTAGADAFVSKTDPPERLLAAMYRLFHQTSSTGA
jgi:DNA-binding NarL/FixJ family response regulator